MSFTRPNERFTLRVISLSHLDNHYWTYYGNNEKLVRISPIEHDLTSNTYNAFSNRDVSFPAASDISNLKQIPELLRSIICPALIKFIYDYAPTVIV